MSTSDRDPKNKKLRNALEGEDKTLAESVDNLLE